MKRNAGSTMFSPREWGEIACNLKLSGRELQIVHGTFDDQTEYAIAANLQISTSTVHTHVERLHHKLAVTNRAQLLLRVMQEFMALTASPGGSSASKLRPSSRGSSSSPCLAVTGGSSGR